MLVAGEMHERHAPCSSRMATPCPQSRCRHWFALIEHSSRDLDMVVHGDDSSLLEVVMTSIGCLRNWMRSSSWCRKEWVLFTTVRQPCRTAVWRAATLGWRGKLTHDTQNWQWQSWDSWRRVLRRSQAAPSRVHHLTTRIWSLTGGKPTTCASARLSYLASPTRHRARLQRMQPCSWERQPVLTSRVLKRIGTILTSHAACRVWVPAAE